MKGSYILGYLDELHEYEVPLSLDHAPRVSVLAYELAEVNWLLPIVSHSLVHRGYIMLTYLKFKAGAFNP